MSKLMDMFITQNVKVNLKIKTPYKNNIKKLNNLNKLKNKNKKNQLQLQNNKNKKKLNLYKNHLVVKMVNLI